MVQLFDPRKFPEASDKEGCLVKNRNNSGTIFHSNELSEVASSRVVNNLCNGLQAPHLGPSIEPLEQTKLHAGQVLVLARAVIGVEKYLKAMVVK